MKEQIILLLHTQLQRWPNNMRRRYPLDKVRRMAVSQADRARRGEPPCVQPVIVTPGPGETTYNSKRHPKLYIVAGHLRHAGNAFLKADAPRLNCVLRFYADEADMLADMSAENGIRAELSPIEWARHFQRQLDAGKTERQVARDAGKSVHTVRSTVRLLELGAAAQELIDTEQLPASAGPVLLRIEDKAQQAEAARRFAKQDFTVAQMDVAVNVLVKKGQVVNRHGRPKVQRLIKKPERIAAPDVPALVGQPAHSKANLGDLRAAAAATCASCEVNQDARYVEPAWHIAAAAAGQVCTACDLRTIKGACGGCPLPEMLARVTREVAGKRNGNGKAH